MPFWDNFDLDRPGPKYLAVYHSIAEAIADGRLHPGRRLPSHRLLAQRLGVAVGTVTRAYAKALDDGLISGEVGRGTFVRTYRPAPLQVVDESRIPVGSHDLFQNFPVQIPEIEDRAWAETLAEIGRQPDLSALVRQSWSEMIPRDQVAGSQWIGRMGIEAPQRRVINCPGVQSALCAIVAAATDPGDTIATASLSHPGIKLLAEQFGLRVHALPIDEHGLTPEGFEEACHEAPPKALYVAPTIHSPTTATMPADRRRQIAAIADKYGVWVIEDESAAFLLAEPPPPVSAWLPHRSFFIGDVWLALSLGLRTTYVLVPESVLGEMDRTVAASSGLTTPLVAEVASRWILSDVADTLIAARRKELEARYAIVREILGDKRMHADPYGHHIWLELPAPWSSDTFALAAEQRGIAINAAEWFAVGHGPIPDAVRICTGNPRDRGQLRWALEQLARLIDEPRANNRPTM